MKASFSVIPDPAQDLLRVTLSGFFEVGDVQALSQALDEGRLALHCAVPDHLALVDIRELEIQSQTSVAAFQEMLGDPSRASKRMAFVVAKSLARMQAKRAASARDAGYFASFEEAEGWLLGKRAAA